MCGVLLCTSCNFLYLFLRYHDICILIVQYEQKDTHMAHGFTLMYTCLRYSLCWD